MALEAEASQVELTGKSPGQLRAELDKARADLKDLYELRHGFFGQTGVHIGARVLKKARAQFEREEARLKERIALLEKLLENSPLDPRP